MLKDIVIFDDKWRIMECKNCGSPVRSNYCSECGQRSIVDKITFSYLARSITDSVFQIERGFLFTLKELILRPAKAINDFIEGKRVRFYKPFAYVVIMSTISSFLVYLIDLYIRSNYEVVHIQVERHTITYYLALTAAFFSKYQILFYFLMIPVISLCSWSFFSKKLNYWENIVLNTYITAQFNLLIVLAQLSRLFIDGTVSYTPYLIIFFTYIGFVYSAFFSVAHENKALFRIKMVVLIFIIVFIYTTGMSLAGMMSPWW